MYSSPDRTVAPLANQFTDFALPPLQTFQLRNGLNVHLLSSGHEAVTEIVLLFQAGKWYEQAPGVAGLAFKMLKEGTSRLDDAALHYFFESLGCSWDFQAQSDFAVGECLMPTRHLPAVLPVLADILTDSTFPEDTFEIIRSNQADRRKVEMENLNARSSGVFRQQLFGAAHPYGYYLNPEEIQGVELEQVRAHYRQHVAGCPFSIYISGLFDQEEVLALLEEHFGQLPIGQAESHEPVHSLASANEPLLLMPKADSQQVAIRIGKLIFTGNHPDRVPFSVTNALFGGAFSSRLMSNLREEKGLTYGVSSSSSFYRHAGVFSIGGSVNKDSAQLVADEIFKEMERMWTDPVTPEELADIQTYLCGNYLNAVNSPMAISGYVRYLHMLRMDPAYYDTYISRIRSVTVEQVTQMAKKYLSEGFIQVRIG